MPNSLWNGTNAREIRACVDVLLYVGMIEVSEISHYFEGDMAVCPVISQVMMLT
jgi:hypothetical protein